MSFSKKLNLLPLEYKNKYIIRYMNLSFAFICGALVVVIMSIYIKIAIISISINSLQNKNTEYIALQEKISTIEVEIQENKQLIEEHQRTPFPFLDLLQAIEYYKTSNLTIISADSLNRLVSPVSAKVSDENNDNSEGNEDNGIHEDQKTIMDEEEKQPDLYYTKDLRGEKLSVRGYSLDTSEVSKYIYNLSQLPFVADMELKAVEENTINGNEKVNVFEIILTLK